MRRSRSSVDRQLVLHIGAPPHLAERLGHASAMETLDTYAHLSPDEEDRSRQAVEVYCAALQHLVLIEFLKIKPSSKLVSQLSTGLHYVVTVDYSVPNGNLGINQYCRDAHGQIGCRAGYLPGSD